MSRFARIGEEAILRQTELTAEEFRLYINIVFHTFVDTGVCRKNLRQLSALYNLSYTHTTERYKILIMDFENLSAIEKAKYLEKIKSPWCEPTKKGIRPLVGLNVPKTGTSENGMFRKPEHDSSENRNINVPKTGTFEDEMFRKPEHLFKGIIEPFKDQNFLQTTTAKIAVTSSTTSNGHLSKFSQAECLRYLEIRIERGEKIDTPHRMAKWLYQTGEDDVFIGATLYPEKPAEIIESAPEITGGDEMTEKRREGLEILTEMKIIGEDLSEFERHYTPEDWRWLMERLT